MAYESGAIRRRENDMKVKLIKQEIARFFASKHIRTRIIYRTCDAEFGDSLGGGGPDNLVPKDTEPDRVTIYLDFDQIPHMDRLRQIIAFPESVAVKLPRHPRWHDTVKVDLDQLHNNYVFDNWDDLRQNYSRMFSAT